MARPGAFSANFDPKTLDSFREQCQSKGEKYTKVLEQLAMLWMETDGAVLSGTHKNQGTSKRATSTTHVVAAANTDLIKRIEKLEEADEYNEETFSTLFRRLEVVEQNLKVGKFS